MGINFSFVQKMEVIKCQRASGAVRSGDAKSHDLEIFKNCLLKYSNNILLFNRTHVSQSLKRNKLFCFDHTAVKGKTESPFSFQSKEVAIPPVY